MLVDLGFRISIVSAIPDLSNGIPGSEAPDSLDSRSRKFSVSGVRNQRRPRIQLSLNFSFALLPEKFNSSRYEITLKFLIIWEPISTLQKVFHPICWYLKVSGNLPFGVWILIVSTDSVTPNLATCSIYCIQNSAPGFQWNYVSTHAFVLNEGSGEEISVKKK